LSVVPSRAARGTLEPFALHAAAVTVCPVTFTQRHQRFIITRLSSIYSTADGKHDVVLRSVNA
jgi:hypothetical protein